MKFEKSFRILLAGLCLAFLTPGLAGADSTDHPVIAEYCDGTSLAIYPVSFVTRTDGSTFICGEVTVTPVSGGLRYGFEDANDGDYNDVIVELRVTAQGSGTPVVQVTYVSKSASYGHEIHLRFSGAEIVVFNADSESPGSVFPVALPSRECPDFSLTATPTRQAVTSGATAAFTVRVNAIAGYSGTVTLTCPGAPSGITAEFLPPSISAGDESRLLLRTDSAIADGEYPVTIQGRNGDKSHTTEVRVKIVRPVVILKKTFLSSTALRGDTLNMELVLSNASRTAITHTVLVDTLPEGLEYLDDNAPVAVQRSGRRLSWTLSRLRAGQSHSFRVQLRVAVDAPAGILRNRAEAYFAGEKEPLAIAEAELDVQVFEITLNKSVNRDQALPGSELTYSLNLKNNSPATLENFSLTDLLPSGLEFLSAESSLAFSREGRSLTWKGRLASDSGTEIKIRVRILASVMHGTIIRNTAKLTALGLATPLESNPAITRVTGVAATPGSIRFSKRCPLPQTEVGRIIRFDLEVENRSASPLVAVLVEDPLPRGFTFVTGSASLDGRALVDPPSTLRPSWNLPDIPPGARSRLSFQAVIAADARRGRHVNRAELRALDTLAGAIHLSAEALVFVSSGGLVFTTGIEGTVFLDRDGDESLGARDTVLEGIAVRISTGDETVSDREGRYKMEGLYPGEYAVSVNPASLPQRFRRARPIPRLVVLSDGLTETVDFPLRFRGENDDPLSRLEGRVFFDRNGDGGFDPADVPLNAFRARLDERLETGGEGGRFVFTRIPPGTHTITITAPGVQESREFTLEAGRHAIDIPLKFSSLTITVKGER